MMSSRSCSRAALTVTLLAIAACDQAPVAPDRVATGEEGGQVTPAGLSTAPARVGGCQNNLKQIGLGVIPTPILEIIVPAQQTVDAEGRSVLIRGNYDILDATLPDRSGANATCGSAVIDGPDGQIRIKPTAGTLETASDGRLGFRYWGDAAVCQPGRSDCTVVSLTGTVLQGRSGEDDPVWQMHGPGIAAEFPVQARFVFPEPEQR